MLLTLLANSSVVLHSMLDIMSHYSTYMILQEEEAGHHVTLLYMYATAERGGEILASIVLHTAILS